MIKNRKLDPLQYQNLRANAKLKELIMIFKRVWEEVGKTEERGGGEGRRKEGWKEGRGGKYKFKIICGLLGR